MTSARRLVWSIFACVAAFAVVAVAVENVGRLAQGSSAIVVGAGVLALLVALTLLVAGPRFVPSLQDFTARLAAVPETRFLLIVLAVGGALRLAWLAATGVTLTSDGSTYFELARRLVVEGEYRDPRGDRAYWPPGYPFYLAALMSAIGIAREVVVVGNLAAFAVTLLGAWWLGRTLVSPVAGLVAASAVAVWPNLVFLAGTASKEGLLLAAVTTGVCLYAQGDRAARRFGTTGISFAAGLALGVAALTQPSLMLFPVVFLVAEILAGASWQRIAVRVAPVLVAMACVILPWTARNAAVLGAPIAVSTNGGDVFYRANNPLASGGYVAKGPVDLRTYGELERGAVGYRLGMEWIRDNPADFLRLALDKQLLFLGDNANAVFDVLKRRQVENSATYVALKGVSNLFWLAVWVAILVGCRRLAQGSTPPGLVLLPLAFLYLLALDSVFESGSRHHVPVAGLLAVLAAAALTPAAAAAISDARPVVRNGRGRSSLAAQFLLFASVGVMGTAAHYAVLAGLVELLGSDAVAASAAGFVVGAIVNYFLNYRFTFRSREAHYVAAPKFLAVAGIGFVVNAIVMALGVNVLGLHYLLAQIVATGVALIWNFVGNRAWTFRGEAA